MNGVTLVSHLNQVSTVPHLSRPHIESCFTTSTTASYCRVLPLESHNFHAFKHPHLHKRLNQATIPHLDNAPLFHDSVVSLVAQSELFGIDTTSVDIFIRRGSLRAVCLKFDFYYI